MIFVVAFLAAAPPAAGQVAFVSEATSSLRARAEASAPLLLELPIWTAVRVERVEQGAGGTAWARVVVGPRTLRYDAIGGDARPLAPRAFSSDAPRGFLRADSLDTAPPPRAVLAEQALAAPNGEARRALLARVRALDPFDPSDPSDHSVVAAPRVEGGAPSHMDARSPFLRVDLVFGCRGDLARAAVVGGSVAALGSLRPPFLADDVCVGHVDVRPPCAPASSATAPRGGRALDDEDIDEGGEDERDEDDRDEDDRDADEPARAAALTAFKSSLSRVMPRFGQDGPALRIVLDANAAPRPVFIVTRLLAAEGCSACGPTASTTDVQVDRLRVPAVATSRTSSASVATLLHVVVPRYAGVVYDVVGAASAEDLDAEPAFFELGDAFDADPREDPGPGAHFFMAPAACGCPCDE